MKNLNPLYENFLDFAPKVIKYGVRQTEKQRSKIKNYAIKKWKDRKKSKKDDEDD